MIKVRVYIAEQFKGTTSLPSYFTGQERLNTVGRIYLGQAYRQVRSESNVMESKNFVSDGYINLIEIRE